MRFMTQKMVIDSTIKNKQVFYSVRFYVLEEVKEITTYRVGDVTHTLKTKWVLKMTEEFTEWDKVQTYLENTVYKNEVFIQNNTKETVNFFTISCSRY